jgi:hypothetical protein
VNVISLVGLWMGRYRLSKRQVSHLVADCFGIERTASSVVNQQPIISQALAKPVAEPQPYVQQQPASNVDEPGWRQVGSLQRSWLWVV